MVSNAVGKAAILQVGVAPCVGLLEDKDEAVQLSAVSVLRRLAEDGKGAAAVGAAGATAPLVKLIGSKSPTAQVMTSYCWSLLLTTTYYLRLTVCYLPLAISYDLLLTTYF